MIVFQNQGEIDIRSISTFGVSVKEGNNPIGFFGTGLKYAIAVLLRTGHRVTIMSGETVVDFSVKKQAVRGQEFDIVAMSIGGAGPVELGFTTELGKQWELWMAYREIACNCKDEGGDGRYESYMVDPIAGVTQIIVQGDEFESVFGQSHLYILEDEPSFTAGTLEVRLRPSNHFFYRGVRVHGIGAKSIYTYNEQTKMELTEDRSLKNAFWDIKHRVSVGVLRSTDKQFLRTVITAPQGTLENNLDFHDWGVPPSKEFLEVVDTLLLDNLIAVNQTAKQVWQDATQKAFSPKEMELTNVQKKSVEKALDFCSEIGFPIRGSYPIKFIESLGNGCMGLAKDGVIFIAERTFQMGGTKYLASTLIEEYIHLKHGYADETRDMQHFLFDKIVSLGEEMRGEPL